MSATAAPAPPSRVRTDCFTTRNRAARTGHSVGRQVLVGHGGSVAIGPTAVVSSCVEHDGTAGLWSTTMDLATSDALPPERISTAAYSG